MKTNTVVPQRVLSVTHKRTQTHTHTHTHTNTHIYTHIHSSSPPSMRFHLYRVLFFSTFQWSEVHTASPLTAVHTRTAASERPQGISFRAKGEWLRWGASSEGAQFWTLSALLVQNTEFPSRPPCGKSPLQALQTCSLPLMLSWRHRWIPGGVRVYKDEMEIQSVCVCVHVRVCVCVCGVDYTMH